MAWGARNLISTQVYGTLLIRGQVRGPDGVPAKHALVELWHADPYGRAPFGGFTPLAEAHRDRGTLPLLDKYSLDGGGCHIIVKSNTEGRFSITTTAPGAYGPPQHFELYIHGADGFAPLYTKVYFGDDPYLKTLAPDNVESLLRDHRVVTPQFSLKPTASPTTTPTFDTAAPTSTDAPTSTPTIDTGVARNAFDSQNATLDVDVVLQTAPASSKDFAGTWSDGLGLIRVASNGRRLLASEYPSPRKWGAVGATHATAYTLSDATFRVSGLVTGELFKGATDTIRWSSGDTWRRYDDASVRRYRYLRISINETFRQRAGRIVEVDDIEIYGGIADHEDKVPPVPLEGRELSRPFRCWATTNTEDCFKAFDKRENAPWRSADVGGWAGALAQTQVLTLDVGDGHQLAPTKLRIKCGVSARRASRSVGSFDCPRFLVLEGAVDGEDPLTGRYEFIVAHRVPNEPGATPAAYGGSGLLIEVASATAWRGRPAGASCGSCASRSGCVRNCVEINQCVRFT